MFGTIRRHQSWLWIIIAGITILSFLVYFGNGTKLSDVVGGSRLANYGTIGGKAVTREQYIDALNEAKIYYFFNHRQWPDRAPQGDFNEAREAYMRLFLVRKLDDLGIEISPKAVADYARKVLGNASPDDLVNNMLKPENLTFDDFERYIRHSLGIEQMYMTAGLNGLLVTPQEADTLYRNEHQDVVSSVAFFSATNYLTNIVVTPAVISQFYTNELANYRIPRRVEVEYVKFNITNHLAEAKKALTNLDEIIDKDPEAHRMVTNAESRAKVKDMIVRGHALQDTAKDANAFAVALDGMPAGTNRMANLATLAAKSNLTVRALAPFDAKTGPHEFDASSDFIKAAFKLTPDEPFAGPIRGEDGVYVIALKRMLPTEIPPLKQIETQVTKDYRTAEATRMAQEAAIKFHATATNELAHGKSFAAIAAQAGVKPQSVPPFSVSAEEVPAGLENRVNLRMLKEAAFSTSPGKVSPPIPTRDGGGVFYVEKKLPVDEAKMKKEFPEFLAYVRRGRQGDAFNQWIQRQFAHDPVFAAEFQKAVEEGQKRNLGSRPNS